jgi:hypothetical protein
VLRRDDVKRAQDRDVAHGTSVALRSRRNPTVAQGEPIMRIFALAAALTSLLAASSASAQGVVIYERASGSAIACVPMSSATWPVPWAQTHGKVLHNGTTTQDVVLFCPVAIDSISIPTGTAAGGYSPATVMTVKYVDPDGTGTQANVLAELKYADAGGNMVELAVASSSAQTSGSTGIATMDANIAKGDYSSGHLFVQLTIHRTTAGLAPAVYGYSLH